MSQSRHSEPFYSLFQHPELTPLLPYARVGFGEELTNAQPLDMTQSFLGSRGLWILWGLRGYWRRSLHILETNTVPWKVISVQTVSKMKLGGD